MMSYRNLLFRLGARSLKALQAVALAIRAWKNRPTPAITDGLRPSRGTPLEQFREQIRMDTDL